MVLIKTLLLLAAHSRCSNNNKRKSVYESDSYCAHLVQPESGQVSYRWKESSLKKVIGESTAVGCLKGYLHQAPSNINDIRAPDRTPRQTNKSI